MINIIKKICETGWEEGPPLGGEIARGKKRGLNRGRYFEVKVGQGKEKKEGRGKRKRGTNKHENGYSLMWLLGSMQKWRLRLDSYRDIRINN
jgi:hypothetical protein